MQYIVRRLNIRGFLEGLLFIVNPWIYLLAGVVGNRRLILVNSHIRKLEFTFFVAISCISLAYTWNFRILFQIVSYYYLLNMNTSRNTNHYRIPSLIHFLKGFLLIGFMISCIKYLVFQERIGLFNSEINFSGYLILLLLIIFKINKKLTLVDLIICFGFIFMTGSRGFLVMSLLAVLLFNIRHYENLIVLSLVSLGVGFVYFENIMLELSDIEVFSQTGYIEDYSRLFKLYDSSSIARLGIVQDYIDHFQSDIWRLLFGNYFSQVQNGLMESHNSLFQRTYEYGLLPSVFVISLMWRRLDAWIFAVVFIYGFFLHNLFSLPLILFVSNYAKEINSTDSNL